jgi:hypothetical protein
MIVCLTVPISACFSHFRTFSCGTTHVLQKKNKATQSATIKTVPPNLSWCIIVYSVARSKQLSSVLAVGRSALRVAQCDGSQRLQGLQ